MKPDGCPHSDCARCNGTVAKLEAELAFMTSERDYLLGSVDPKLTALQEAAQDVVDTANVHSLSRNSVTKASLVALAALLDKGEKDG